MSPLSAICFGLIISLVVFASTDAAPQPQFGGGFGNGGYGGGFNRPGYGRPVHGPVGIGHQGFGPRSGPNISISKSISISGGGRGGAISSAQSRSSGK